MTEEKSINHAMKIINPLCSALEDAFWDTSEIQVKDHIFDLVLCLHAELNELAKLSVSDLDMPYEPITLEFANTCSKLNTLMTNANHWFHRTTTLQKLKESLPEAASLLKECRL